MNADPSEQVESYSFRSRYGVLRSLSPCGWRDDGYRHYIVDGASTYVRSSGGGMMVDFEGGPFIHTGEFIDPDAPLPVRLVECLGAFPCIGADEIIVGVEWVDGESAARLRRASLYSNADGHYYAHIWTARASAHS